jgi:hypothetical protein
MRKTMRISWFFSEGAFMCREYYLHKRPNGIPSGESKKPRPIIEIAGIESINKAIRKADLTSNDAMRIVSTLKSFGLIDISAVENTGCGAVPFIQFLETFWDYKKSEYIQDRIAYEYRFGRTHACECQKRLGKD